VYIWSLLIDAAVDKRAGDVFVSAPERDNILAPTSDKRAENSPWPFSASPRKGDFQKRPLVMWYVCVKTGNNKTTNLAQFPTHNQVQFSAGAHRLPLWQLRGTRMREKISFLGAQAKVSSRTLRHGPTRMKRKNYLL